MDSKIEILKGLVSKEVFISYSDGTYSVYNYNKNNSRFDEFKTSFFHYIITDCGEDMIEVKWLGKSELPKHPDFTGYISISHIDKIEKM